MADEDAIRIEVPQRVPWWQGAQHRMDPQTLSRGQVVWRGPDRFRNEQRFLVGIEQCYLAPERVLDDCYLLEPRDRPGSDFHRCGEVVSDGSQRSREDHRDVVSSRDLRRVAFVAIEEDDDLLVNAGDGTFERQELNSVGLPEGGTSSAVVAEDFNGDGAVDLFVARADPYLENALALNDGDGTFTSVSAGDAGLMLGSGVMSYGATSGDVDRDGDPDLVIANGGISGRQNNTVAFNDGDGTFEIRGVDQLGLPGRGSSMDAVLADFNRDAVLDLFVTDVNAVSDPIYAIGQPNGTFRVVEP